MNFSEKQIVDAYWEYRGMWEHNPLQSDRMNFHDSRIAARRARYKLSATREFTLPSGRRCDVFVQNKSGRFFWVIEFKVVADPKAIVQAAEYWEEARSELQLAERLCIAASAVTICAQYFTDEALWFARQLGIQCVHVAPVNYSKVSINELNEHDTQKMTKRIFHG